MLWTGTHFFKEIQYGQSICINFIFNFYKGLGSYFVFVLYFSLSFTHFSALLLTPHLPREGLPSHGEFGDFSWNGDMKAEGGLGATSPPDAGAAGLSGGLLLASPWALEMNRGEEPPGRGRPGFGQENSRKQL